MRFQNILKIGILDFQSADYKYDTSCILLIFGVKKFLTAHYEMNLTIFLMNGISIRHVNSAITFEEFTDI